MLSIVSKLLVSPTPETKLLPVPLMHWSINWAPRESVRLSLFFSLALWVLCALCRPLSLSDASRQTAFPKISRLNLAYNSGPFLLPAKTKRFPKSNAGMVTTQNSEKWRDGEGGGREGAGANSALSGSLSTLSPGWACHDNRHGANNSGQTFIYSDVCLHGSVLHNKKRTGWFTSLSLQVCWVDSLETGLSLCILQE